MTASSTPSGDLMPFRKAINPARIRPHPVPSGALTRPGLLKRLADGAASGCRLSLVSAPLGYGKSVLLSQYAAGLQSGWAWLRCTTADNQPRVFLNHLVAALALSQVEGGAEEVVWGAILRNLEQRQQGFTLFIDDIHHLRARATCRLLNELLEFGPQGLHILAASRGLPPLAMTQLRRDARLQVLDATDLALDSAEIESLAYARGLELGADALYRLRAVSEGWISSVLLGLAAMNESPHLAPGAIEVRAADLSTAFLDESLLADLPIAIVRLIETTSVVSVFDAGLAQQLSGNAQAKQALRMLQNQDALIQLCDSERQVYRFHPTLRSAGYRRLKAGRPDQLEPLHLRAAQWLLQNCRYAEAVYQLGRARAYDRLLSVVEAHSFDLLRQGEVGSIVEFLADLPERDSDHLALAITEASTVIATNDVARARVCLLRLQRLLREHGMPSHHPERPLQTMAFLRSRLAVLGGNFEHCLRLVADALRVSPQPSSATAVLQFNQATSLYALGRPAAAWQSATAALNELTSLGFLGYTNSVHLLLGQIELSQGRFDEARQRFAGQVASLPGTGPKHFYDLYLCLGQGLILLQGNQFALAAQQLAQAESLALEVAHCAALPWVLHHQACLAAAQDDTEQACRRWDKARRMARQYNLYALYRLAGADRVRVAVRTHDEDFILQWLQEWHWCRRHYDEVMPDEQLAYAWVQRHLGQHALAVRMADYGLRLADAEGNLLLKLQWQVLQAHLQLDRNCRAEMAATLEQALQLAIRHGFGQLLHHEGHGLRDELRLLLNPQHRRQAGLEPLPPRDRLAAWLPSAQLGERVQPMLEPPTRRELDVLRRMAQGQSNQQIADGLFIGLSTVKTHINNLFRKLDANDRETALQAARQLRLLAQ